ncbi:hypothetical protein HD806DRAFT_497974 [Xylariaceae sp. AK1471]|nr:hypothetical protein HD806DRAFT_497974 [Xylariaceae sp. AK1471]
MQKLVSRSYDVHYERFRDESYRLFAPKFGNVECLQAFAATKKISQHLAFEMDSLIRIIEETKEASETFYIIRQLNTFSRLLVTQDGLQTILDAHNVFSEFFDALIAFGFKRDDDHKVWDGYHRARNEIENGVKFEFCFVVRYVEKNNRSTKKPWSLRQVGFYHQIIPHSQKSIWILLQPSEKMYSRIKGHLSSASSTGELSLEASCLFYLDALILLAANWGDYIEYLWADVSELDDKASHSAVGIRKRNDYTIEFRDCQKLQRLRRNLLRTVSVLDSCLSLAEGMSAYFRELQTYNIIQGDEFKLKLKTYGCQIQSHLRNMATMLKYTDGTGNLLVNILNSRNDQTILDTNQAMKSSLELMQRISEQNQQDSRLLKTFGFIATIYLPASLIATIFSSNLLQLKGNDQGDTYFQPASQFWIYIVITASLTILTFVGLYVTLKPRVRFPKV